MSLSPDQKLAAYFLGRRIAGQRRKQERAPVAYLYNGVRLPGLPEFDEPYAVIVKQSSGGYRLIVTGVKPTLSWSEGAVRPKLNCSSVSYNWYIDEDGQEWETGAFHTYPTLSIAITAVWANYDMLSEDETLYLAASDPVPVYE